jgi:hypothetical protein
MHVNMHCRVTVHLETLSRNHHMDATATKPTPFTRYAFDGIPQFGIITTTRQIPHR